MKFIMAVLTIRFIAELISNKRNGMKHEGPNKVNENIWHPAEYDMR